MLPKEQRNYLRGQVGLYPMTGFRRQGDGWVVTVEPDAVRADIYNLLQRLRKALEPVTVSEVQDAPPSKSRLRSAAVSAGANPDRQSLTAPSNTGGADTSGPRPNG